MSLNTAHIAAASLAAGLSLAQTPAGDPPPEQQTAPATRPQEAPTLDELLGLDRETDSAAEQAARQNEEELERRLAERKLGDVLQVALQKMLLSADLLDVEFDAGLATQRVQQDVLAKLDQLIDMAKEMSSRMQMSQGGGGGASGSPQKQDPGPQARRGGERRNTGPQDGQATEPPPGRSGDINTLLEETESEWGLLPPRYREMLEQGRTGFMAPLYRRLTEEYYKRLAEEG